MATISWTSATSGNWNTASNWSSGTVPGPADDAVVNVPGVYQIIASGVTIDSLSLSDAGAQVLAAGAFTTSSGMAISAGTLAIAASGSVIAGSLTNAGTIIDDGFLSAHIDDPQSLVRIGGTGTLAADVAFINFGTVDLGSSPHALQLQGTLEGGALRHVTASVGNNFNQTTLALENVSLGGTLGAYQQQLFFKGGVTFTGSDGTGIGTLGLGGAFNPSALPSIAFFDGDQSLDNVHVDVGGGEFDIRNTLTLGSGFTLSTTPVLHSASGEIDGVGTLLSGGTINADTSGILSARVAAFANAGLFEATNTQPFPMLGGGIIGVYSDAFSNLAAGRVDAMDSGRIQITSATIQNAGTILSQGTYTLIDVQDPFTSGHGTLTNLSGGIINTTGGGTVSFFQASLNNDAGATILSTLGTVSFAPTLQLTNDGTIATAGGFVDIAPFLDGSGVVTLAGNGIVEVDNATSNSSMFDFTGAGTLVLMQPSFVTATINDFSSDDLIRLGVAATAISYTSGDLKMQISGGQTFDLGITGAHTLSDFIITTGTASTGINLACFAAGTRIQTVDGAVPVERLREGDLVLTDAGSALPVVWLGHRSVDCSRHPNPTQVWPIRIAAGAFADNAPERDLYLSPDHAVFTDDVLIPIKYLVNDQTIRQVRRRRVTYYHVELPQHAVMQAECLAAESLVPHADRSSFANGGPAVTLHPDFHSRAWEAHGCAPLVVAGPVVDAVRQRLAARAFDLPLKRRA